MSLPRPLECFLASIQHQDINLALELPSMRVLFDAHAAEFNSITMNERIIFLRRLDTIGWDVERMQTAFIDHMMNCSNYPRSEAMQAWGDSVAQITTHLLRAGSAIDKLAMLENDA